MKSEDNVFAEEINKTDLSSNDDKKIQSNDSIETYAYRTSKDIVSEKEDIRCNNIIKQYKKIINFDNFTNENKTEHNPKWSYIPDHPYRILIIGGSRSRKTNALLNLINNQLNIDKIYLYAKDSCEAISIFD